MNITVLDLGSTTFHAQTYEVGGNGTFITRFDERKPLHLGGDVYTIGRIGDSKWQAAMTAIGELLSASAVRRSDVTIAVATSVLRDAANGLAFRMELWNRHRLGVQLLTPEQEARFSYLGASTTPEVGGRRAAVIDLGGGSMEIAVGEGTRCVVTESLPLGALAMAAGLQRDAVPAEALVGEVAERVRAEAGAVLTQVRALAPEVVVFASGTARNARQQVMLDSSAPGRVGDVDAARLRHHLTSRQLSGDLTVPVASAIMLAVLDLLQAERAVVCHKGLRDGVALDVFRRMPRPESNAPVRLWNRRFATLATVPANLASRD